MCRGILRDEMFMRSHLELHTLVSISQSAFGREVPGNEIKSLEYNWRRTANDFTTPNVSSSCCARMFSGLGLGLGVKIRVTFYIPAI